MIKSGSQWIFKKNDYYLKRDSSKTHGLDWVKNTSGTPTDGAYKWSVGGS